MGIPPVMENGGRENFREDDMRRLIFRCGHSDLIPNVPNMRALRLLRFHADTVDCEQCQKYGHRIMHDDSPAPEATWAERY